jgi:predicted LPLAT superfamily acyltransferase
MAVMMPIILYFYLTGRQQRRASLDLWGERSGRRIGPPGHPMERLLAYHGFRLACPRCLRGMDGGIRRPP